MKYFEHVNQIEYANSNLTRCYYSKVHDIIIIEINKNPDKD
jgi:hypothetical protein